MLARSLMLACLLAIELPAQHPPIAPYNLGLPSGCSVIDFNGQPAIVIAVQGSQSIATFWTPWPPNSKMLALRVEAIMVVDYRPGAQGLAWDLNVGDNHQARNLLPPSGVDLRAPWGGVYEFAGWGGWSMYANFTNSYCKLGQGCPTPQAPQWTVAIATVIAR